MIQDMIHAAVFEVRSSLRKLSTYVYFVLFLALALLTGYIMGGGIQGAAVSFGSERMFINSPLTILNISTLFLALGSSIVAAAFGQAICKDYLANLDQVIYSKPIHIRGFLLGRFLGTMFTMTLVFLSLPIGLGLSTFLPVQANMVTSTPIVNYLQPVLVSIIPNIFFMGAVFFVLASMTKKMAPVYVAGILVLMGWLLSGTLSRDIENKLISALIDPFGLSGIESTIKYWSVSDKQTHVLWWQSYYLWNRIAWIGFGFACLGHAIFRFTPLVKQPLRTQSEKEPANPGKAITFPKARTSSDSSLSTLLSQIKIEIKLAVNNIYFVCLSLAALLHLGISSTQIGKMFGTTTYPVTSEVLLIVNGLLNLYMLIIITFWAGELVWRDRDARFHQIIDSTPTSSLSHLLSKVVAVNFITACFMGLFMLAGLVTQTFKGYFHYEIGLYIFDLFGTNFLSYFFLSALAIFLQTVLNNKYIAHGAMILFYVIKLSLPKMGVTNKLWSPGSAPDPTYSDMNGYGHFLYGLFAFQIFWALLGLILLAVAYLYWPRGTENSIKNRWQKSSGRWRGFFVGSTLTFAVMGGFIYYNTHILNDYRTPKDVQMIAKNYEEKYSGNYKKAVELTTTAVFPKVDIYPHQQALNAKVTCTLENKSQEPISHIFLNLPLSKNIKYEIHFTVDVHEATPENGVLIYEFIKPIAPGESIQMSYRVDVTHPGFTNSMGQSIIVDNGSFIHSDDYFPSIGYNEGLEVQSKKEREKLGLPPKLRMPLITDEFYWNRNYITPNSHWIDFETIVSTSDDQIAIAPGYLIKDWVEQGRHYYHYKMDQKILDFYAFQSGKYLVKKSVWNKVNIEVYYHPGHDKNIDSMILAARDGLEYFSSEFTPYQHKQFRIIEFPRYQFYAQAFPNTIPFSEALGFIAKVDPNDPEDVEYPYYITAHELAHQWWAHQVIGAAVQGGTMLSESLAQYSALMVMQNRFGRDRMKKFLKYELDKYLSGRGMEDQEELPLTLVENQPYIHYQKGSLVFFQLSELLGSRLINKTLTEFLQKYGFKGPPYPLSKDLYQMLESKTPENMRETVNDLFNRIILYNNRITSTKLTQPQPGKYRLEVQVHVEKLESDHQGQEKIIQTKNEAIDIGVRNKKGDFIYLEKKQFTNGSNTLVIELKEAPDKVGIDPIYILIDKNPMDNEVSVSKLQ